MVAGPQLATCSKGMTSMRLQLRSTIKEVGADLGATMARAFPVSGVGAQIRETRIFFSARTPSQKLALISQGRKAELTAFRPIKDAIARRFGPVTEWLANQEDVVALLRMGHGVIEILVIEELIKLISASAPVSTNDFSAILLRLYPSNTDHKRALRRAGALCQGKEFISIAELQEFMTKLDWRIE